MFASRPSRSVLAVVLGLVAPCLANAGASRVSVRPSPGCRLVDEVAAAAPEAAPGPRRKAVPRIGEEAGESEKLMGRADAAWGRLVYPLDRLPAGDWRGRGIRHIRDRVADGEPQGLSAMAPVVEMSEKAVVPPGVSWTAYGPKPLDDSTAGNAYKYGIVSGRINAIAFRPGSATTAFAGMTDGGMWKTTNCCSASTTWTPLWDAPDFPVQSVGAIAFDPSNPDIMYVGTGDSQVPGHGDNFGNGIYKSTDAGATWTQYGANIFSPYLTPGAPASTCCALAPDENVKVIAVDPNDPSTVIAGASFGLFISYDAGVTWTQYDVVPRSSPLFDDDAQRVTGLLVDGSTNPSTMYVAVGYPYETTRRVGLRGGANGVYKGLVPASGAPTLTLVSNGWPAGTGSGTQNDVGRIELAWNAAHTRIYALVSSYSATTTLGVWTTGNGGTSWTLLSGTTEAGFSNCGGDEAQDWYNYFVAVDPNNDTIVYIGRVNVWKLTVNGTYTGTSSLLNLSGVYSTVACGYGTIHPDQHAFDFQPGSNPTRFLVGNDGGPYYGTGAVGAFTQLNAGVDTLQFYAGQIGRDFANTSGTQVQYAFGGMQDNGSASWHSANSTFQWQARGNGGDGFHASFDPIASTIDAGRWYTEYYDGDMDCSTTGATGVFGGCAPNYAMSERRDWSTPFLLDQWNCTTTQCNNMAIGTNFVWATTATGAPNWVKTTTTDLTKNNGRYSQIISLNMAHSNPGSVIVGSGDGNVQWSANVFTGAGCTLANSNTAAFACTANNAATWVNLTGGNAVLPNRGIGGVAFDPNVNTVFYAAVMGFDQNTPGTPGHIFRGTCSASPCTTSNFTWVNKTGNLPDIPFEGIAVNPNQPNQVFVGSWLGFFFTENITQNPPVWQRFMVGMPNTRVSFLTTDRGPGATPRASTTLAAFTFGRGMFATRINIPNCLTGTPQNAAAASACDGPTLSWDAMSGATSYTVLRGTSCANLTALASGVTGTSYQDVSAAPQAAYYYAVQGVNACGPTAASACSGPVQRTGADAPTAVSATADSCGAVTVTWTNGTGATSHSLLRYDGACPSASGLVTLGNVASPFVDTAVTPGSSYCYVVQAVTACPPASAAAVTGSAVRYKSFHLQVQPGVPGYKDMTAAASFEASVQQADTAAVTGAGEYQIGATPLAWSSPAYVQSADLSALAWTFDVWGVKTGSGIAGQLYAKVYRYNGGTPVLLFTTGYASPDVSTASSSTRFTWTHTPGAGLTIAASDRLVVEISLHATAGNAGSTASVNDLASGEAAVKGNVTGTFAATQVCNAAAQTIVETNVGGTRSLEHKWSIPLTSGTAHVLNAVAWVNSATQAIGFQWSDNVNGPWSATMFNAAFTSSPGCGTPLTFTLPGAQTGTIWVRAITVTPDGTNNTLSVDYLAVATTYAVPPPRFGLQYDAAAADSLITASDCDATLAPTEVSAAMGTWMLVTRGTTPGTVVLEFEDKPGMSGYNVYEGDLPILAGNPYTHGGAAGNVCGVATTLASGRRTTPAAGLGTGSSKYYLVTTYTPTAEGTSGYASGGAERPSAQNTCAP